MLWFVLPNSTASHGTYQQVQQQIEILQREGAELRKSEVEEVIQRIKVAIDTYGLSAEDLGLNVAHVERRARRGSRVKGALSNGDVKFRDGEGHTWGGRGPRPHWLREALAAGHEISEFAV